MFISTDANQAVINIGELVVAATGLKPISDQSVEEFLAHGKTQPPPLALIQYSPKQSPNAAQRARFAAGSDYTKLSRVVIVSDSTMVRGAITALQWLLRSKMETKPFKPAQAYVALAWLNGGCPFALADAKAALAQVTKAVGLELPAQ